MSVSADKVVLPITFEIVEKSSRGKRSGKKRRSRTTGRGNLVSKYGVPQSPRKHYKTKREADVELPETSNAPFVDNSVNLPGFGGSSHLPTAGYQFNKVTKRGKTRYAGAGPAFPNEKTFLQRIRDIENGQINQSSADIGELKNTISTLLQKSQILSNPQGFVGGEFLKILGGAGPYGLAVVGAITAIVTAPEVVAMIIKTWSQKGLPLNRDYRRTVETEINALFDIEEQKKRLLGIDSYISTQIDSYNPDDGANTINSLRNRDEIIIAETAPFLDRLLGVEG